ncbi:C40 family peptidase [Oribacterium sp. WCC10]|uniref:C40 family peptidase n=1 Tax=Oribacterium sp. WCC10 TaxID=1855343 RepID=UPI0008E171F4|nr:C40 family peptidase [Oribacterium sp. WCC10]SFG56444.1 Cell wall-associated hydrolase, NlpC family [Oribacterium sp. WCC10]
MSKLNFNFHIDPQKDRDRYIVLASAGVLTVLVIAIVIALAVKGQKSTYSEEITAESLAADASLEASGAQHSGSSGDSSAKTEKTTLEEVQEFTKSIQMEAINQSIAQYSNLGIVKCDSYINFRSAPDQNDLTTIMGMLANGSAVDIIEAAPENAEGWMHVRSGGMEGYVASSYIATGDEAVTLAGSLIKPRATVLADKLRIRSTPEIADGNTVGSAAKGEKYEIISRVNKDWIMIASSNIDNIDIAYMSASDENVSLGYGLDEAKSLNLKQKVLNMYDNLGVSLASDYINVRSSPKEDGIANIIGKFPGYGGCNILGEENGWYHIKSGSVDGYVRADLLATGQAAQDLAVQNAHVMAIINTQSLNVRSQASTDSEAWTQVTSGQRYDVVNQMDGWVELDLGDGDDSNSDQGSFVSTRDNNVSVTYALQEAIEYYPAVEAANAAAAFRNKIVNFACQFVGNPYVWGGTSLTHGADCSGFVQSVLKNFGISVPRVSRDQAQAGVKVTSDTMKPGDLVFYANRSGTINHVGMYIGNGQIVNAASSRSGIRIYRWNYRTPVAIRNVIGD